MSIASMHSRELRRSRFSIPLIDKCTILPIAACAFALIISPLFIFFTASDFQALEARPENRIFWPVMAVITGALAVQNRARLARLGWPPHLVCLFLYLGFAGLSVLWSFSPESSLTRFVQQVMIITSIVLPAMLAARSADMMHGLFLCFAFASILNLFFVIDGSVTMARYGTMLVDIGYQGYFMGKNYLGECAGVSLLFACHEFRYPGKRRTLSVLIMAVSVVLVFMSDSKTALGLAFVAPLLATLTLIIRKVIRLSPALILMSIPVCFAVLSRVSNFSMGRISYMLYGDSTITGRTIIWDFVQHEIDSRSLLGWGYQSFWLVPGSPSAAAPGWVKMMPNAHNGYYDTMLEMGHVGLVLLILFIIATLHATGRVADRDPRRAWLVLSLALYIILFNFLESLWMRGFEFLWVVFVILAAEIGRHGRAVPPKRAADRSSGPRPGSFESSAGARPRPRIRLS